MAVKMALPAKAKMTRWCGAGAEADPRARVEHRIGELERDHQPREGAHQPPDQRGEQEHAHDGVVVDEPLDPFSHPGASPLG
jgi:hypothetical protein